MLFPNVTQGGHPLYCTPNKAVRMHVCVCVHVPSVSFCVLFTSLMALYRRVSHDIASFVGTDSKMDFIEFFLDKQRGGGWKEKKSSLHN